jgi:hypothetical protein
VDARRRDAGAGSPAISVGALRWSGVAGALGALVLFAGDLLFYFGTTNPRPGAIFLDVMAATMSEVAPWRLLVSGALAPIGGWLCLVGAWQVYLALQPAGRRIAVWTGGAFAALMVWAAVFHAALVPQAMGQQIARLLGERGAAAELAVQLPAQFFSALLLVLAGPLLVYTVLFVFAVLARPTRYPRWMVAVTPTLLFVITHVPEYLTPAASGVGYVVYCLLAGGAANLGLLLFFAAATAALWHGGSDRGAGGDSHGHPGGDARALAGSALNGQPST